jgi:ADP-heptose:LPS heptosyltransferase
VEVLALRALGLGDLLTAVPALRGLRRAFPAARLRLAAPAVLRELALHTGAVDDVVAAAPLEPLPRSLPPPDLAVNLHGRGPQSTRVLQATAPRRLLAHDVEGGPRWDPGVHEVVRWCRLLEHGGIPADPADLRLAPVPVAAPVAGAVLVHPGAAQRSRHWPVDRWAQVVRCLAADGHDVRVTGGPDERELATFVASAAALPSSRVLAGRTGLLQLAALVSRSRLLVSVDTGVAHLATAFGTPSVVLFGPTAPALWGPPPDRPQHRVLWAGRTGDNFAAAPDPGLLEISVELVIDAARAALAGPGPSRR